jgi:cytochrome P450
MMGTALIPLAELYDPLDPAQLADPWPVYRLAREHGPFYSRKVLRGMPYGIWVVSSYDDVEAVARDGDTFSSSVALMPLVQIHEETRRVLESGYPLGRTTVETDGIEHQRTAVPLKRVFSPHTVSLQEGYITGTAERLVTQIVATGQRRADIIGQLAHELPFKVINHLFGVPEQDHDQVRAWCEDWMRFLSMPLLPAEQAQAAEGMESYFRYMAELVRERRREPRDNDIVTLLAQHQVPGLDPLDEAELVNNLGGVLFAGHVTTTALIGNAVHILLGHRGYWDGIAGHPEHIPAIVEEVLRYRNPTKAFPRVATKDTQLSGVTIRQGELVQLLFASANHDETKWANPEVFDPWAEDRGKTRLMSFGYGPHTCIGAPLARAQARIALEVLSRQLPGLRLAEQEYRYIPVVILYGLQQLWVEW